MITQINPKDIEIKKNPNIWCLLPYRNHAKGCPNYGTHREIRGFRKDLKSRIIRECPPVKYLMNDIIDFSKPVSLVYNIYELGKDAEQRRINHPNLKTPGDWYNLRYWQGRARSQLNREVEKYLDANEGTVIDLSPEAHGVNLTILMQKLGQKIEFGAWPPKHSLKNVRYQIALGGYPKKH